MSGLGIQPEEEFSVYCDPPAEQAAPSEHQPGHEQPLQPGQEAGASAAGPQRQPLGDRTAEYWRGYYKPLIEADEAAALQSPVKHLSPSLRPGSRSFQPSGSPTKHTPSKGPPPALLHATAAAAGTSTSSVPLPSASKTTLGLPPRSPLPPKHPLTPSGTTTHTATGRIPAQEPSSLTNITAVPAAGSSLVHASSSGSPLRGASDSRQQQQQQQQQLQQPLEAPAAATSTATHQQQQQPQQQQQQPQPQAAMGLAAMLQQQQQQQPGSAGNQPQQPQQQPQPAMGLAALLQQQQQQVQQQQPGSSSHLKRGGSPGPESASKVKRGLMFPP